MKIFSTLFVILIILISETSWAGSFQVEPIKIFLDSNKKSEVLQIKNMSDKKISVQLKAIIWTQDENGKDINNPTNDIIFFPKILTVEKEDQRIVRVGLPKEIVPGEKEKTYRLFIEELPSVEPVLTTGVKIVLRIGVPIFLAPLQTHEKGEIESINVSDGKVIIKIKNTGNLHFVAASINVKGFSQSDETLFDKEKGGWYIFPDSSKPFELEFPRDICSKLSKIEVKIMTGKFIINGKSENIKNACSIK